MRLRFSGAAADTSRREPVLVMIPVTCGGQAAPPMTLATSMSTAMAAAVVRAAQVVATRARVVARAAAAASYLSAPATSYLSAPSVVSRYDVASSTSSLLPMISGTRW